jgi:hypothetical protein
MASSSSSTAARLRSDARATPTQFIEIGEDQ